MNGPEGFLARWNRRKQEAKADAAAEAETSETSARTNATEAAGEPEEAASRSTGDVETSAARPVPAFDIASLPPIESITAASDIRAFLAPGVPAELARAALRRAWSADPAVRDFVGIAENQWDFTVPNEILGFGPLESGEDITRLVAQVFGDKLPDDGRGPDDQNVSAQSDGKKLAATEETPLPLPTPPDADVEAQSIVHRSENNIATQYSEEAADDLQSAHRRGHGRALPQ